MTERFDLYGWPDQRTTMREAALRLGVALGVELSLHNSYYWGGNYWIWEDVEQGSMEVRVQPNFRDDEGYLLEPEHEKYGLLTYVSGLTLQQFSVLSDLQMDILRTSTIE